MKNISIVIGRFQPFHKQHLELVKRAMEDSDEILICIGSVNQVRSIKNPLTFEQRKVIITTTLINAHIDVGNVAFCGLEDMELDSDWLAQVSDKLDGHNSYTLFGHHKDESSYYLDLFNDFGVSYCEFECKEEMNATDVRQKWFGNYSSCNLNDYLDPSVSMLLVNSRNQQWYKDLMDEDFYIKNERSKFLKYPYSDSLNVATADAVIVNTEGEVCMIRRKGQPQKGLLALVGGHKESNETFLQCAIREAGEEIGVKSEELVLVSDSRPIIADNPDRDPCLPKHSIAYVFAIGNHNHLTAADDADSIEWIKWSDIPKIKSEIAFDHFDIIAEAFAQRSSVTYL